MAANDLVFHQNKPDEISSDDLVSVTYISHSLIKLSDLETVCNDIRESASRNNAKHEISGLLLYCRERFIQRLEGKRQQIDELIAKIKSDKRHRKILILHHSTIDKRYFSDWSQMRVFKEGEGMDDLDRLFINLESGGREIPDDKESRFILNFIQHFQ